MSIPPPPPSPPAAPHPLHTELALLEKFHSTLRIYRDLFSKPGARTVNWAPLMDVKYEQLVKHNQALKGLKAALDETPERTREDEETYARAWGLYLAALEGYGELCEILKPRPGGTVATVGVRGLEGRRGEGRVEWGVGDVGREGWRGS
ncbi:uncharacterized protein H6S33_007994 [Morchella sextelata]|uniref:uncharacterized protein n=1 Tax=Morchella sextelata TaxID=1174677 RepID=UPI001D04D4DF|nr:uncharacterized protein H6S33_007994 [Morchella sextelata]KAH0602990.1 hypothetical protein H6S33_007994 [Morchella sextelata]